MALWLYGLTQLNKFDNWPVGAYVIRFATAIDKNAIVSFINGVLCKGTSAVLSNSYRTWLRMPRMPRIPGCAASSIDIMPMRLDIDGLPDHFFAGCLLQLDI